MGPKLQARENPQSKNYYYSSRKNNNKSYTVLEVRVKISKILEAHEEDRGALPHSAPSANL